MNLYSYVKNSPVNYKDPYGKNLTALIPVFGWIPGLQPVALGCGVVITVVVLTWGIVDWIIYSKGGKQNQGDSGLENLSDEEVTKGSKDKNIPKDQRERFKKEDKWRRNRHKGGG